MKNVLSVLTLSVALGFQPSKARAVDLTSVLATTTCVAGAAYLCMKACDFLLRSGVGTDLNHQVRKLAQGPAENRLLDAKEKYLSEMKTLLHEEVDALNEQNQSLKLTVVSRPELHRDLPMSDEDIGYEFGSMTRSLGGKIAMAHAGNLMSLGESVPENILNQLQKSEPRFLLNSSAWPLLVQPYSPKGGEFDQGLDLALYIVGPRLWVIFEEKAEFIYNEIFSSYRADGKLIESRFDSWAQEYERTYTGAGQVRFSRKVGRGPLGGQQGPFGPVYLTYSAVEVITSDPGESLRANLFVLTKIAELVRQEKLAGNPAFKSGFRTQDELLKAAEEKAKHKPGGIIF